MLILHVRSPQLLPPSIPPHMWPPPPSLHIWTHLKVPPGTQCVGAPHRNQVRPLPLLLKRALKCAAQLHAAHARVLLLGHLGGR